VGGGKANPLFSDSENGEPYGSGTASGATPVPLGKDDEHNCTWQMLVDVAASAWPMLPLANETIVHKDSEDGGGANSEDSEASVHDSADSKDGGTHGSGTATPVPVGVYTDASYTWWLLEKAKEQVVVNAAAGLLVALKQAHAPEP
jgi:hypothetical protein